jgi:hypothetical protein
MLSLALFCLVAGALLGFRHTVYVLIPVIVPLAATIAVAGALGGVDSLRIAAHVALVSTALQLGYIAAGAVEAGLAAMSAWAKPGQII